MHERKRERERDWQNHVYMVESPRSTSVLIVHVDIKREKKWVCSFFLPKEETCAGAAKRALRMQNSKVGHIQDAASVGRSLFSIFRRENLIG